MRLSTNKIEQFLEYTVIEVMTQIKDLLPWIFLGIVKDSNKN